MLEGSAELGLLRRYGNTYRRSPRADMEPAAVSAPLRLRRCRSTRSPRKPMLGTCPVARARLLALGVEVVEVVGAPDNHDLAVESEGGTLPFLDASFSLVINRHESSCLVECSVF